VVCRCDTRCMDTARARVCQYVAVDSRPKQTQILAGRGGINADRREASPLAVSHLRCGLQVQKGSERNLLFVPPTQSEET
jgi:hypothetical protein